MCRPFCRECLDCAMPVAGGGRRLRHMGTSGQSPGPFAGVLERAGHAHACGLRTSVSGLHSPRPRTCFVPVSAPRPPACPTEPASGSRGRVGARVVATGLTTSGRKAHHPAGWPTPGIRRDGRGACPGPIAQRQSRGLIILPVCFAQVLVFGVVAVPATPYSRNSNTAGTASVVRQNWYCLCSGHRLYSSAGGETDASRLPDPVDR